MQLSPSAIHYTIHQFARWLGCEFKERESSFQIMDVSLVYTRPDSASQAEIIIVPSSESSWTGLLSKTSNSLDIVGVQSLFPVGLLTPFHDPIPILFWGEGYEDGSKPFVERREDGTVVFYADILAAIFFMVSRWEETVVPTRDLHDRFPATASVAYKQGFLDRPIVDEYVLILQAWLKVLRPEWTPRPRQFSVKLSHDIDHVRRFASLYTAGRAIAGDVIKRRSPSRAIQTLQATLAGITAPEQDPYLLGIYDLADLSEQHGLQSAFYFMATDPGPYDAAYDPASEPVRRCIDELQKRGHEVGFHPGYSTLNDPQRFTAEKSRIDALLGQKRYGGRQHYLRFRTPDTWRQWEAARLAYDSTLSFADHEGFRCGTCHPYQPFDVGQDRWLDLVEIPLIVMDGTLKQYRGLTPEEGQERILALAKRCRQVNGIFTLLWHNTSLQGEWEEWWGMYIQVLSRLTRT